MLRRCCDRCSRRLNRPPPFRKSCYLSETKLKRGFKACFGCTVYEYVVEKRMEMARRLLQSGKYRVKEVVWMTGYSNAGHFIDTFRKRYGVTPSEIS
ncbi:helix-turn-helix domain-containing protein [Synergistes jonesii]|uniref:helix-turn-helix domain-containing protein n=1 Tax=Synergistes jonesii TaxID=2754 RepID=UPI00248D7C88|nr:AraC family transcriptional regulator [Synergistes jonesii]